MTIFLGLFGICSYRIHAKRITGTNFAAFLTPSTIVWRATVFRELKEFGSIQFCGFFRNYLNTLTILSYENKWIQSVLTRSGVLNKFALPTMKRSSLLHFSSSSSSQVRAIFLGTNEFFFSCDRYKSLVDWSDEMYRSRFNRSSFLRARRTIGATFMSSFTWNDMKVFGVCSTSMSSSFSLDSDLLSTFFGTKNLTNISDVLRFLLCSASIFCRFSSSLFLRSSSFSRSIWNQ